MLELHLYFSLARLRFSYFFRLVFSHLILINKKQDRERKENVNEKRSPMEKYKVPEKHVGLEKEKWEKG